MAWQQVFDGQMTFSHLLPFSHRQLPIRPPDVFYESQHRKLQHDNDRNALDSLLVWHVLCNLLSLFVKSRGGSLILVTQQWGAADGILQELVLQAAWAGARHQEKHSALQEQSCSECNVQIAMDSSSKKNQVSDSHWRRRPWPTLTGACREGRGTMPSWP